MEARANEPSGWAVGWTYFAGFMMILIGLYHVMAGFVAIVSDEFYVATREYILQFDTSTWGWIHMILGIVVLVSGLGLFSGSVAARTIGTIMAVISALAAFAWLPYFPVWGIIIIATAVSVIWALTAHGRDVTRV
jgi:hypothetical protein